MDPNQPYDDGDAFDEEPFDQMLSIANPSGTVRVSTFVDGRVHHVALSQTVISMTEADLAEEIVVIAQLATENARAAQYQYVLEGMCEQGHDAAAMSDFLSRDLDLPSPEDARNARAQLFAMRYGGDDD